MRTIPLLLCCMSVPAWGASLPPLVISPDLVRQRAPEAAPAERGRTHAAGEPAGAAPRSAPTSSASAPAVPGAAERGAAGQAAQPAEPVAPGSTTVRALRIHGTRAVELTAEGDAELQRGDVLLTADRLIYREATDEAIAEGHVRLARDQDVVTGPAARFQVGAMEGEFEAPQYAITRVSKAAPGVAARTVSGNGHADALLLEGENQYRLKNATWTTCQADDPDWYIKARDLKLDYDREVGTARGTSVVFQDVPIFWAPWAEFPLVNQRQSGLLTPTFGTSNKTGIDLTQPYYWNIAPNYDATFAPRWMSNRGLQLGGEFRYLTPTSSGSMQAEWLRDSETGTDRALGSLQHSQWLRSNLFGAVNLNGVSDDEYFHDLSSRLSVTSRVNLVREGRLIWFPWEGVTGSALVQSYQTLSTDPENPIETPYRRLPELRLDALRPELAGGTTFAFTGDYVRFDHPNKDKPVGSRFVAYPQLSLPYERAGYYITPKVGVHYTRYELDRPLVEGRDSITRTLPIVSVDSGLTFERDTQIFGQSYTQTLEPRIYYLHVPYENQEDIPVFDSARYDFGFAQIFSENLYTGSDRIADANQLTTAVSSRLIDPVTGGERLRATIGQRFYFADQRVTLNEAGKVPVEEPRSRRRTDFLAALSGQVTPTTALDSAWQYNPKDQQTERFNFAVRYRPEFAKALNVSYRYYRDIFEDVDLSGQWPIARDWYGVARITRSLRDGRITEAIAGVEYNGGCWVFRTAVHRFVTRRDEATQALFFQLELGGLASVGSSPVNLLKRSVPGYGKINEPVSDRVFGTE